MSNLFVANGELGQDLLAVDWEATPLGPPEAWPQSLKTIVRVLLTSRFSMWMAWGPELTMLFNESYRRGTLGSKYPWALAKPAQQVWEEIWSDIGPRIETVMSTGVASWDESLLLFLERSGYREETYHTFSYSPLSDDEGRIVGMLCVVSEDTDRVIGERRLTTLRELGTGLSAARTEVDVCAITAQHLAVDLHSLPFSLVYLFQDDGAGARLVSAAGVTPGHPVAPHLVTEGRGGNWPIGEVIEGRSVVVDDLAQRFEDLPCGAWEEPPLQALLMPLVVQSQDQPFGFLVAGLNRYRPLDREYHGFVALVASQIAASIANARAYEAERQRAETLAELDRAKTTFFTNISHEFRTPLTLLLGPVEDALNDQNTPLAPEQRARVELVQNSAQRLLKLVNTLLDFSRLESGRVAAQYEPLELASYTTELVSMFKAATERAGLRLDVSCGPLDEPVYIDREMWAKIVSNLLSNALKFTFSGGISVRLTEVVEDGRPCVQLEVEDTGIGIDPADQLHLFERFHRVVGARARTFEGSGIGLALVAELAQMHGGSVAARSDPGVGSVFSVRVPLGHAHLAEEQLSPAPPDGVRSAETLASAFVEEAMRWLDANSDGTEVPGSPPPAGAERPRVLVVDDNADMRRYLRSLLVDSYVVDVAPDGAVAFEIAVATLPDLVLTDVMMPNMDGFALLAALRGDPRTSRVPVVMLSARSGEEAAVGGLEAGADDYLTKPFSAMELAARVRSNIELERARRQASREEHRIADELQRSLVPAGSFSSAHLEVATFYQAGVRGTRVGGDWYDVIELGAGRTALIIGDVMGRGVRAAAVMGQLRAAVRAYARLDLPPADILEFMDSAVRDLDGGQLVTCIYAIYDPTEQSLTYSNAGHLPPLLTSPGQPTRRLSGALGRPLGAGPAPRTEDRVSLVNGSQVALYTDGLVERRDRDLDAGIDAMAAQLDVRRNQLADLASALVESLRPDGADDDVAILVARVPDDSRRWESASWEVPPENNAVARARSFVTNTLRGWAAPDDTTDTVQLLASELVTNAIVHGLPPIELRLRSHAGEILLEVLDGANFIPRKLRPTPDDEHGRGLQLVALLADRWGSRVTDRGKAMWCVTGIKSFDL